MQIDALRFDLKIFLKHCRREALPLLPKQTFLSAFFECCLDVNVKRAWRVETWVFGVAGNNAGIPVGMWETSARIEIIQP